MEGGDGHRRETKNEAQEEAPVNGYLIFLDGVLSDSPMAVNVVNTADKGRVAHVTVPPLVKSMRVDVIEVRSGSIVGRFRGHSDDKDRVVCQRVANAIF